MSIKESGKFTPTQTDISNKIQIWEGVRDQDGYLIGRKRKVVDVSLFSIPSFQTRIGSLKPKRG